MVRASSAGLGSDPDFTEALGAALADTIHRSGRRPLRIAAIDGAL